MKILIVGEKDDTLLIAEYIKMQNKEHDIFVTKSEGSDCDYCTFIDIKSSDIDELRDFVKYNEIDFTLVLSKTATAKGIADEFKNNSLLVCAPDLNASSVLYFESTAKKLMYKLKIPTPRFGIFDKEAAATEYLRNADFPLIIKNDCTLFEKSFKKQASFSKAKKHVIKMFENPEQKVVIENFVDEKNIYLYFITDGYNALPLISIERYYFDGGSYAYNSSEKLPEQLVSDILHKAVHPLIDELSGTGGSVTGILGLKVNITGNSFSISEINAGFSEYDLPLFLSVLDDDLLMLFFDAAAGSLCDNRNYVNTKECASFSVTLPLSSVDESIFDDEDIYITETEGNITLSALAQNRTRAKNTVKSALELYSSKEISDKIYASELKEEIGI